MWSTRLSNSLLKSSLSPAVTYTSRRIPFVSVTAVAVRSLHTPHRRYSPSTGAALRPTAPPPPVYADIHQASTGLVSDELPITSMDDRRVAVGWDTRTWSRFHHIWLRDHCRCPVCFHSITKQRLVDTFEIPPDIKPIRVASTPEGLQVVWPEANPHISLYPWSWLRTNSYDPPIKRAASEKILWGAKIAQAPPTVTFEETMNEQGAWKWLSNVNRFGFCFVTGVPPTPEATEALARRIGFIRETQYGTFWDFTSDLAKGDTAYTQLALTAHTDNTYFTDPSGLQLFHLLSHTDGTGGSTLLVDGFYTAALLADLHPDLHSLLASVPVPAHAAGEEGSLYRPKRGVPVLSYEPISPISPSIDGDEKGLGKGRHGELVQVRWNNHDRSALRGIEPGAVEGWYEAARVWNRLLTSPDSEYWSWSLGARIDEQSRVLDGRSAFTGARRMSYCIGNAAGLFMWLQKCKPRNHVPWIVIGMSYVVCPLILLVIRYILVRENKRRDAEPPDETYDDVYIEYVNEDGKTVEQKVDKEFLDLTDIQNRDFRYVL